MFLAPVEGFKGQLKAASRTPRCLDAVVFVRFAALQHDSNYRDWTSGCKAFLLRRSNLGAIF
jgi:hypothetical protein